MRTKRRVTIKEVAAASGVSTQTVSRVLNNRPDVAQETLERVQQVIKETGYSPNILARSLIRGRSHILGVVAYGLKYYGPSRVLTGIERQAAELGYSIFLHLLHEPETDDVEDQLNNMLAHQVDGILWAIPEIGGNRAWVHAKSPDFPVPVVFVGGMGGQISLSQVGVDNRSIGRLATQHLLDTGARCIGIITGPLNWWEAQQRQRGWSEALEARGIEVEDRLVVMGDWSAKSGEQALQQLLAQTPDLDAVFASNDQMALGALYAAHRLGRRIPEDLAVVGVDNIPEAAHFWPPLTTVRQGLQEVGALAVQEVDQWIQKTKHSSRSQEMMTTKITFLQPEIIIRESSREMASS